ncbi:hypothetical protein [Algoriphagus sp. CAU 1675]|uniref:hypothetical protein n=1 Tax=Algoriphagus sp. CAU 1675 TaxID=3032597 RepID=UPI0023DAA7B7|nr:hypothetical protein [Algoriphagus sp. CAU 1675]MDF2157971.1 hypothetical protein [Algoriphagus sp. CAU 1675]
MKIPGAQTVSIIQANDLVNQCLNIGLAVEYKKEIKQLEFSTEQQWMYRLFIPWNQTWSFEHGFKQMEDSHIGLVLIRAGQACTGYIHNGELMDHKVFRAYMVRKKQGKSQIKHLKTKGKSRAGSRIRLEESARFFEDINERLSFYGRNHPIDYWGISCGKTLWPYFFASETAPPFSSKNDNLIQLPYHIDQASFQELKQLNSSIHQFQLLVSERGQKLYEEFSESENETPDDNW